MLLGAHVRLSLTQARLLVCCCLPCLPAACTGAACSPKKHSHPWHINAKKPELAWKERMRLASSRSTGTTSASRIRVLAPPGKQTRQGMHGAGQSLMAKKSRVHREVT